MPVEVLSCGSIQRVVIRLRYGFALVPTLREAHTIQMNIIPQCVDPASVSRHSAAFYPNLVTARFYETWDFYTTHLGFRTVAEHGSYVHLEHPSGSQLGILRHEVDGDQAELVTATDGRGFWISLDVDDADAEYARLQAEGLSIPAPIENKPWGDRQFMVKDPNGILIAIAHRIQRG